MRSLLASAALVLSASGCCFDVARDDACVVSPLGARPYCFRVVDEQPICTYDESEDPPPLYSGRSTCDGTLYENDTCAEHGFSERCPGDFFVLPRTGC